MTTVAAPPWASTTGISRWDRWTGPARLMQISDGRSVHAEVSSARAIRRWMPALWTSRSRPGIAANTRRAITDAAVRHPAARDAGVHRTGCVFA